MNFESSSARQPAREVWSHERLVRERAIAIGFAIENSSALSYSSALQSYVTFCHRHQLPVDPSPDTLSLYVVYMCHFISPSSVSSYLSGICSSLESYFPHVRDARKSPLVVRTLAGSKKRKGVAVKRKLPFSTDDLAMLYSEYTTSPSHDDLLFLAIMFTAFFALMRLGELVLSDNTAKRSYRKQSMRHTVVINPSSFSFLLPFHKADRFYEGNSILITSNNSCNGVDPVAVFTSYLRSRDSLFPAHPELWLRDTGSVPTRSWFIHRLRRHFSSDYAGHSLRAGGATTLALSGVPPERIQAIGRWSSNSFQLYIRKHPALIQAFISNSIPR